MTESIKKDPLNAAVHGFMVLAFFGFYIYLQLANKYERLIISSLGIQYISPLRGVLNSLQADWFLRWEQVTDAYIQQPHAGVNANLATLNLVTPAVTKKLQPTNWINPATWQPPKRKLFDLSAYKRPKQSVDELLETELVSAVQSHLPRQEIDLREGSYMFNLGSHPATVIFTLSLWCCSVTPSPIAFLSMRIPISASRLCTCLLSAGLLWRLSHTCF
jgi:hypothetical protein